MNIRISIICMSFLGIFVSQAQQKKAWTLQECIEYALKNNITIKQSELNFEASEIDEKAAIGNFLPRLNAQADNFWNSGLINDPITGTNINQTIRSSSYGASLGVDLFKGLSNWKTLQRARVNKLLNQYSLNKSKDDIALLIANNYLQVLLNKESLKVIQKQHEITLEQLERTRELVEAGVLPQGDLLEIKATSADEITRIVQAENGVLIARIGLAQTILIKDYDSFDTVNKEYLVPSSDIIQKPINRVMANARESRYEVQIAEQNKIMAENDVELAKTSYYPSLSASFGANTFERTIAQVEPDPVFEQFGDNRRFRYGVSLSIPIFNGFSVRNQVKRSKINVKRTAFQLEQAKLDLDSNVYQAYLDAKGSAEAYEAASVAVKAQEKAYEYAKDRYDVGMTNAFDFSQSKFRYENAQSQEVRAKFDYIFKIKVLELYFGVKISDIKL